MRAYLRSCIVIVLVLFLQGISHGAQVATSAVTFNFLEINEIAVTGTPTLTISTAVAGQQPLPVTDATSRYAVSTNGTNKRITASINKAMPASTTLEIRLAIPGSGTSLGYVMLSTMPADVVTGINASASSNRTVTYRFSATTDAGVVSDSCTVTLTLSD